jgi:NAD(P)-dependent dehydrogenase (short-subunit alcohol dehydrogenase family)
VINAAGLDGQFGRAFKTDRHPHVNMSKAALNMITRTSAADYARDGISMNSVDVGWVMREGAYSARVRMRESGFVPPLDEVDAAARIYDLIVRGLGGERNFTRMERFRQADREARKARRGLWDTDPARPKVEKETESTG